VSSFFALGYLLFVGTARVVPLTRSGAGPTDAVLVASARAGERWAAEALFRRHEPLVSGMAYRLMGRDEDVDDLVQETFAQALARLETLKDAQALAGWLCSILVGNVAKTIRRRRMMARFGVGRYALAIDLDTLVGPSVPADDAVELRRVYALAETLPDTIRVPLVLQRVEGLSLEEIAELVGCSLATVKRRVAEGEARLRERFLRGEGR